MPVALLGSTVKRLRARAYRALLAITTNLIAPSVLLFLLVRNITAADQFHTFLIMVSQVLLR